MMNWQRLIPTREALMANRWLRWLAPWLGHPRLWRWSRRGVALGVALGVFFGLLIPLAQIPVTAAAAIVLRANIPAAAASTLITNPLTFPPLYYAAYKLGGWVTGDAALPTHTAEGPAAAAAHADASLWQRIAALGKPLLVGLFLMACFFGVLSYFLIDAIWQWRRKRRHQQRQHSEAMPEARPKR